MPTATFLPRCPHRVAATRSQVWQVVLLASLLGSATATSSLSGQEVSLLDYRFAVPAGHMQPWPDAEPDIFIAPLPVHRIAAKWRTNLSSTREEEEKSTTDESKLPGPILDDSHLEDSKVDAEVLVIPQPADASPPDAQANPTSQPRDCYQATSLSAMSVNIGLPAGKLPTDAAAQCASFHSPTSDARQFGAWAVTEQHWSATNMRHRPLYFEEINAERYGYTVSYTLQPIISAARFFATIPALPYKMAAECPRDCIYTLGHYRPGSCVPRRWNRLPWQLTAGVVETGFIAGMILLIP